MLGSVDLLSSRSRRCCSSHVFDFSCYLLLFWLGDKLGPYGGFAFFESGIHIISIVAFLVRLALVSFGGSSFTS